MWLWSHPLTCRAILLTTKVHSLKVRNRLAHETVRQLMFALYNLNLLEPNVPVCDDDLGLLESAKVVASPARRRGQRLRQRHALGRVRR
jgi:hypothetical protein